MDLSKAQLIESVFAGGGPPSIGQRLCWDSGAMATMLRACVRVVLGSGYPMLVCRGPSYPMLYNDPYRPLIGRKHPAALGRAIREVILETWDFQWPRFDKVMAHAEEESNSPARYSRSTVTTTSSCLTARCASI